jgi:hypothetical protein
MHRAGEERGLIFVERAAIPGNQDFLRQPLDAARRFDLEFEAHAPLAWGGQARYDADHVEIAAFEPDRQTIAHAMLGEERRPHEAERERKYEGALAPFICRQAQRRQGETQGERRQLGLQLQERRASRERERRQGHLQSTRPPLIR